MRWRGVVPDRTGLSWMGRPVADYLRECRYCGASANLRLRRFGQCTRLIPYPRHSHSHPKAPVPARHHASPGVVCFRAVENRQVAGWYAQGSDVTLIQADVDCGTVLP